MDTLYVHIMSVKPFKAYIPTFIVRCLADIVQTYIRHISVQGCMTAIYPS